jgi:GNAT superfamily N-acetyltransferase
MKIKKEGEGMNIIFIFLLFFSFSMQANDSFVIRSAYLEDIDELLSFDRHVTYEFFKPLYLNSYSHLTVGQSPDYFLELELENDKRQFIRYIQDQRLYVACDASTHRIIGFVSFHIESHVMTLDLLLVVYDYRGCGVGKALIKTALQNSSDIDNCAVFPFCYGNDAALKFYELLGFVPCEMPQKMTINFYGIPYADMHLYYKLNLAT